MEQRIKKVLDEAGLQGNSLDKIRLAKGVVGKSSYVFGSSMLVFAVIAWNLRDPAYLILLALVVLVAIGIYWIGTLWFASRHPEVALLDGAELIRWRQMEMSAKGQSRLSDAPIISSIEADQEQSEG